MFIIYDKYLPKPTYVYVYKYNPTTTGYTTYVCIYILWLGKEIPVCIIYIDHPFSLGQE